MGPLPQITDTARLRQKLLDAGYRYDLPSQAPQSNFRFDNGYQQTNPITNFIQGLISPIDQDTGLPNADLAGPVMTGITGPSNAAKLLEELYLMGGKKPDLASTAINFIKLKYPKIYATIQKHGGDIKQVADPNYSDIGGVYRPEQITAYLNNLGNTRSLADYIKSITHELGHFARHARGYLPEMVEAGKYDTVKNLKTNKFEDVLGTYEQAKLPKEVIAQFSDPDERKQIIADQFFNYFNQPAEVAARKAGATGWNAYYNFINSVFGEGTLTKDVMNALKIPVKKRFNPKKIAKQR